MDIIIYGSQYGTARQYAEELGRRTNMDVKSYRKVSDINSYTTIVYFGALYAGGVMGMSETIGKITFPERKRIVIATVGLADPTDPKNIGHIRDNIKRQLPPEVYDQAEIFHLRGGIDYSKLRFKHRIMMRLVYKKALEVPESERNAELNAMIETYGKKVDFVDFTSLDKIIDTI